MANGNAKTDQNGKPTFMGTLQSDGVSTAPVYVNPTNGGIKYNDGTSGTASTRVSASIDDNGRYGGTGVSSADGVTIIPIAVDSSGNLLIQSS